MTWLRDIEGWRGIFGPNSRRVLAYLRPQRHKLWLVGMLGVLYVPLSLVEPYLLFYLVDRVLLTGRPDLLVPFFRRILPFFALAISVEFLLTYTLLRMARDLHLGVKAIQLDNLLAKGLNFFRGTASGRLLFAFFNDSNQIGALLSVGMINTVLNLFFIAARLAVLWYLDFTLMLIFLSVIPFQAVILYKIMKLAMRLEIELKKKDEELTSRIESMLRGAITVKAFSFGGPLAGIWKHLFASRLDVDFRNLIWKQVGSVGVAGLQGVSVFLILFIGVYQISNGELTLGELLAFLAVGNRFAPSVQTVIGFFVGIQEALVNIERYYRIYDMPNEVKEISSSVVSRRSAGTVQLSEDRLDEISIRHVLVDHGNGAAIRVPCDFVMARSRRYCWYGPNGSGKTSVALALAALVPHSHGSILLSGTPLNEFSIESIRRHILYVGGEPFWPERTLEQNFLNSNGARLESRRLESALFASTADAVLGSLPKGMKTTLSDSGHILSRGENQRLFLAMALYREPRVLILDESLSNVTDRVLRTIMERLRQIDFRCLLVHVSQRPDHYDLADERIAFGSVG